MANILDRMLEKIADLKGTPDGAYNIRQNGEGISRASTDDIQIIPKTDKPGIDIYVEPGTHQQFIHIPVVITKTGFFDKVYNDFYIGERADVTIVAGCGIHNNGCQESRHDGIHSFHIGKGARVKYIEKHYAEGKGSGSKILNPVTHVELGKDSYCEMETTQIRGVDSTKRYTKCTVGAGAEFVLLEKLLTHDVQQADSEMDIFLNAPGAKCRVISRSVAQDLSYQVFYPKLEGNSDCFGHIQCDAIIMGSAKVRSIPEITANHVNAQLIHEAAIGRLAEDQIAKLMTLGLTAEEAEEKILSGFLK